MTVGTMEPVDGEGAVHENTKIMLALLDGTPNLSKALRADSSGNLKVLAAAGAVGTSPFVRVTDGVETLLIDAAGNAMVQVGVKLPAGDQDIGSVRLRDIAGTGFTGIIPDATHAKTGLPVVPLFSPMLTALANTGNNGVFADIVAAPGAGSRIALLGYRALTGELTNGRGAQLRFGTGTAFGTVFMPAVGATVADSKVVLYPAGYALMGGDNLALQIAAYGGNAPLVTVEVYYRIATP